MKSKRALKQQVDQARKLLRYTLEKCEEQQVISGCSYDDNNCALCHTYKGQYIAQKLYDSLSMDKGAVL